ncbi:YcaO-like family protein [Oceanobacillus sp. M65]|uniref:YcaO-like family protein n=1 Tax=Oceanobacillus sp. M65 TaxID=3457435 RepID=UPI002570A125
MKQIHGLDPYPGEPDFPIKVASLGDISYAHEHIARVTLGKSIAGDLDGAGGDLREEESRIKAIAEALERYSSCIYDEKQFIWATANELGNKALDLTKVPMCSEEELAHPRVPVRKPQLDAPLRWVKGISLHTQKETWIPAIMSYLHLPAMSPGEKFWLPISTGCATHTSYEQALVNGINEVIERDAISLTWYQQLPLPHIIFDEVDQHMQNFLDNTHTTHNIKQYIFDGTTDVGIPTVYSLQLTPHNDKLGALIMCATDLNPKNAINKVMREAASSRIAMMNRNEIPHNIDDFHGVFHGASYMAKQERLHAYDFLVNSENQVNLSQLENLEQDSPGSDLNFLLNRLEEKGFEAYAVDLTTDEAMKADMKVVRVIIPGLQPLSFSYRCRFLAHPRLYEGPRAMGYEVKSEEQINKWPQPFA